MQGELDARVASLEREIEAEVRARSHFTYYLGDV